MKKYYLCAEKQLTGGFRVSITDNPLGMEILKEFEAENYVAACHRYSFVTYGLNTAVYCGVRADGTAYHGEAAK